MQTEMTITSADARAVIGLIAEYLTQGGIGFDADALDRVAAALSEADRVVIIPEFQQYEQGE